MKFLVQKKIPRTPFEVGEEVEFSSNFFENYYLKKGYITKSVSSEELQKQEIAPAKKRRMKKK